MIVDTFDVTHADRAKRAARDGRRTSSLIHCRAGLYWLQAPSKRARLIEREGREKVLLTNRGEIAEDVRVLLVGTVT